MTSNHPMNRPLPPHVAELVQDGALFVCNHSGGKDSQAMFAYLTRHVPADQIVVVHADLGRMEWAGVQDHIRANIGGFQLHVVQADRDLLQMVRDRHDKLQREGKDAAPWPSSQWRYCTSDLKRGPVAKFIRRHSKATGQRLIVNCLGLRAEESSDRAKRAGFRLDGRLTIKTRTVLEWLPVQDWTLAEVWQAIDDSGQQRHWAYDRGMSRLSCCFCILASKGDLTIAAQHNPELFREYVMMERDTGYTMRQDGSLEEITGLRIDGEREAEAKREAPRQIVLGTPINPAPLLDTLAGYSFCVSYASRAKLNGQLQRIIDLVNADANAFLLVDNGAFTHWRQGGSMTDDYVDGFEAWATDILDRCPKAIAVLPDVIGGSEAQNWTLACESGLDPVRAMPIWHLHESLDYLRHLVESGFPMIGFGSSGDYASGRGPEWEARIAEAFAAIDDACAPGSGVARPHIHMMRCQGQLHRFPFNSADSTNVAINHNKYRDAHGDDRARFLADRIKARCDAAGPVPLGIDVWAEVQAIASLRWPEPAATSGATSGGLNDATQPIKADDRTAARGHGRRAVPGRPGDIPDEAQRSAGNGAVCAGRCGLDADAPRWPAAPGGDRTGVQPSAGTLGLLDTVLPRQASEPGRQGMVRALAVYLPGRYRARLSEGGEGLSHDDEHGPARTRADVAAAVRGDRTPRHADIFAAGTLGQRPAAAGGAGDRAHLDHGGGPVHAAYRSRACEGLAEASPAAGGQPAGPGAAGVARQARGVQPPGADRLRALPLGRAADEPRGCQGGAADRQRLPGLRRDGALGACIISGKDVAPASAGA